MCDSAKEQWYNENCEEIERLEKEHRSRELHKQGQGSNQPWQKEDWKRMYYEQKWGNAI